MAQEFPHVRDSSTGRHRVSNSGHLRMTFYFSARKYGALHLHVNGTYVAQKLHTGNLEDKIKYARELLARFESDAPCLRDVIDGGIAQHERKADDYRARVTRHSKAADALRDTFVDERNHI